MNRFATTLAAGLLLALTSNARAQDALVEGPGVKIGESTVLHPEIGLEAGVVSNVFFEEASEVVSPIMRVLGALYIAPAGEDRLGEFDETTARKVDFRLGVEAQYTEYLTSNDQARKQRNLDVTTDGHLIFMPKGNVSFALRDRFQRLGRPTNFESTRNLDRDINHFIAELMIQPVGHNISAGPRYENIIDYFESDQSEFANRIQHIVGAKGKWKFFPYTQVYLDASVGFYDALGNNDVMGTKYKIASTPLRIIAGLDTALLTTSTLNAYLGYANGFYDTGPSYNIVVGGVDYGWRYVPTGRFTVGYSYDVHDSINANYYGEHRLHAGVSHQINRVVLAGGLGVRFRGYRGIPDVINPTVDERDDFIVEATARAEWIIRDQFSLYLDYGLQSVNTDFLPADMDDPSFLRHELVLGLVAAF